MKVTPVSPIFPSRKEQELNREDSENTANPQSSKKGKKEKKKEKKKSKEVFKEELSKRMNPLDKLDLSSSAQSYDHRRHLEEQRNLDAWAGL